MTPEAEKLVAAVRAKGSNASDPRDAAHEACHALRWGVRGRWTRDNIHASKPQRPAEGVREEILARAVEQLVSKAVGYDCGTLAQWAFTCWMEMAKNEGISLPTGKWLENAITSAMGSKEAKLAADQVLALAATPKRRSRR